MKLKKDAIKAIRLSDDNDDGYVSRKPGERFKMIWEITCDLWAFGGKGNVERRLQRNVTNFVRRKR